MSSLEAAYHDTQTIQKCRVEVAKSTDERLLENGTRKFTEIIGQLYALTNLYVDTGNYEPDQLQNIGG